MAEDYLSFESTTGLKVRPLDDEWMVFADKDGEVIATLPKDTARLLTDEPEKAAQRLEIWRKLQTGEMSKEELVAALKDAGLAQSSTQSVGGFRGAHLEQVFDSKASQALLDLGEAVRQGEDPMVAGTLAATALFGDWLGAEETKRLLLSFVPIVGQAIAAEDFVRALEKGEYGQALLTLALGIGAPVAGRGLVRLGKDVKNLFTKETGALSNIETNAAARTLTGSAETNAAKEATGEAGAATTGTDTSLAAAVTQGTQGAVRTQAHERAAQLARDAKAMLVRTYGEGGDLSNWQYLEPMLLKMGVPPEKVVWLKTAFSRDIIPPAAEREVGSALSDLAEGLGFRLWQGKRSVRARLRDGDAFPDLALKPANMSDEEFGHFVKDSVANIDKEAFAIFEVKTGTGELRTKQKRLVSNLVSEGKGDIFVLFNLPQNKIRPEFLAQSVEKYMTDRGIALASQDGKLLQRLSQEIQKTLPRNASVGEAFFYTMLVTCEFLGVEYAFDTVQD